MRTVKQAAEVTGVSVRTLQYYDEIGLLKPTEVTEKGYRLYDDTALEKLQEILFFREFDFPLRTIRDIMESPDYDRKKVFQKQKTLIQLKRDRLDRLLILLERLERGEKCMSLKEFDLSEYLQLLESFREQNTEEIIEDWGSIERFDALVNHIRENEQRIGKSVVERYGSVENYTAVIKEGLDHFSEAMNRSDTKRIYALYRMLTEDLKRDAKGEQVQDIVRKIVEMSKGQMTEETWAKAVRDIYSSPQIVKLNDSRYGEGATEFMKKAFTAYFTGQGRVEQH